MLLNVETVLSYISETTPSRVDDRVDESPSDFEPLMNNTSEQQSLATSSSPLSTEVRFHRYQMRVLNDELCTRWLHFSLSLLV